MDQEETVAETAQEPAVSPLREVVQPFIDLVHAPRALWGVNLPYFLEGISYWGWLSLLAIFFNKYVALNDIWADWMVMFLTAGITFSMLVLGGVVDRIGVRKALIASLLFMLAGRFLMVFATGALPHGGGLRSGLFAACVVGLLGVVIGYGMNQPASYAGVREFCDARTSAMGYAMLYAVMNAGGAVPGLLSPPIRMRWGIPGVYWTYVGITALSVISVAAILTPKVQRRAIEKVKVYQREHAREQADLEDRQLKDAADRKTRMAGQPLKARVTDWIRHHPFSNPRFTFFIFCLIPVQTLFAHNWLTLPQYVHRAMGPIGQHYMEFFVNTINPTLIFVLTPTVAALTRKFNVYKMMIAGTLVMALPAFLLSMGTNIPLLLAYLVIMSVGEAMWQPRFLQYAAEIAPKGQTGAYMGVAQFPWFLTKVVTGLYAGWFLMRYVPEEGTRNPQTMWLIYAFVALISPILLILARRWMMKDFRTRAS